MLLVHWLEQLGEAADGFRRAQQQESTRVERVVESGEHLLLQAWREIDEQVTATDEVHMRERRVAGDVLPSEDDHLSQGLTDPIPALFLDKEPPQPLR